MRGMKPWSEMTEAERRGHAFHGHNRGRQLTAADHARGHYRYGKDHFLRHQHAASSRYGSPDVPASTRRRSLREWLARGT
jgi:hypothetical protein